MSVGNESFNKRMEQMSQSLEALLKKYWKSENCDYPEFHDKENVPLGGDASHLFEASAYAAAALLSPLHRGRIEDSLKDQGVKIPSREECLKVSLLCGEYLVNGSKEISREYLNAMYDVCLCASRCVRELEKLKSI